MTRRRHRWLVGAAALVGLAVRLAWVRWAAREPEGIFVDPARYLGYADQIARGNGMVESLTGEPTAYYPPGYPWFVGIVAWTTSPLTDEVWLAVGVVQAVLGALSVLLVAFVAHRLAGPTASVVAAAIYALYPNLVFHTGAVLGETLYNVLFLAFLATVLARPWTVQFTVQRALASGVLLGLAVMVRPISLAVVPVLVACWMVARKDWSVLARWSLALLVGVAACILPWTARNAVRLDAFVPISTNTGDNLCIGHAEGATGAFAALEACRVPYPFLDGLESELAADRAKTRIAIRSTFENLDREPWLLWQRAYVMWIRDGDHDGVMAVQSYRLDRWIDPDHERVLMRVADVVYWAVAVAGAAGLVALARRRHPEDLFFVGAAAMTALVPLAFFGDSRFKVPVIPLLIIAAATLVATRTKPASLPELAERDSLTPPVSPPTSA